MTIDIKQLSAKDIAALEAQIKAEKEQRKNSEIEALAQPVAHYSDDELRSVRDWITKEIDRRQHQSMLDAVSRSVSAIRQSA